MFIISIIITTAVVGYISSLAKKRLSIWVYMLTALLGAIVGTGLSFGDSSLFLKFPFFNIFTVPLLFSALFALVALLADRGKMAPTIIPILIILGAISGLVYLDNSPSDYSGLLLEKLTRIGVERVGQPVEGFSAPIYLEAFPGLMAEDFDGVQSVEGIYVYENGILSFSRMEGRPITTAEEMISGLGHKTLLANLSKRLGVDVNSEADVDTLFENLRE